MYEDGLLTADAVTPAQKRKSASNSRERSAGAGSTFLDPASQAGHSQMPAAVKSTQSTENIGEQGAKRHTWGVGGARRPLTAALIAAPMRCRVADAEETDTVGCGEHAASSSCATSRVSCSLYCWSPCWRLATCV